LRRLTEREVRFLCWKIKRGDRLPNRQLVLLLDALLARTCERHARYSSNDNAKPKYPGCPRRNFLFEKYQRCLKDWTRKVTALGEMAGRRDARYPDLWKAVIAARLSTAAAKGAYDAHRIYHEC
jgi:hypothetical protein